MNAKKLQELENLFQKKKVEKPEKGFFTRAELCKAWNISEKQGNRKLKNFIDSGLVETKTFKVTSGMVTRPIPHYRIKDGHKK